MTRLHDSPESTSVCRTGEASGFGFACGGQMDRPPNDRLCCGPPWLAFKLGRPEWGGPSAAALVRKSIPNVPCCPSPIHEIFFPTALWPLLFGRESFGLGRREPLPHSRS